MINFNGTLTDNTNISINNRGYRYGDYLFETIKVVNNKILFWEDHYFRLMASMRILRMEIPMSFTMEFLQQQILDTLNANALQDSDAKVRLLVNRAEGGLYLPTNNTVDYIVTAEELPYDFYLLQDEQYEVDLFKDYYVSPDLLSTLKTNNKALNVVGSVYASENDLDNCLILNTNKNVVEALNGNLFLLKDKMLKTPPLKDGCLKGIMRKQILDIARIIPEISVIEESISPFELQKVDEMFITNVIQGIVPVTKYRKKTYRTEFSRSLLSKLNTKIRLD
ncbi:MAG: aminotransferase class IV [Flavobacteriaceae bacterium]|nr:aminotransferase class IV [Flavobacteriaceae bacterium]